MIAFIGSGPHNLMVLAFVLKAAPHLRSEVAVFDPSGAWLTRWDQQMAAQQIVHLRSSSVHHPDPDALALRRFAKGRFDELYPPYFLPGTGLFREFCQDVIDRFDLEGLVQPRTVTHLEPLGPSRVRLTLDDGTVVEPRAVVSSLGGGEKVWPAWAPPAQPPTLMHSEDVRWDQVPTTPGRLLMVGGGLTAGHLALGALQRGWKVDLVTRRPIKYKLFDAAPGWIGPKYLAGYLREISWERRRKMIAQARGGGAMTEEVRDFLKPYRKSGQLTLHPRCEVKSLIQKDQRWEADCGWGRRFEADLVWLCTGNRLDLTTHPLFAAVHARQPLQMVEGLPVLEANLNWPGLPLYFTGMSAALRVGPTARNFPGGRQVAARIAQAITGVWVPPT